MSRQKWSRSQSGWNLWKKTKMPIRHIWPALEVKPDWWRVLPSILYVWPQRTQPVIKARVEQRRFCVCVRGNFFLSIKPFYNECDRQMLHVFVSFAVFFKVPALSQTVARTFPTGFQVVIISDLFQTGAWFCELTFIFQKAHLQSHGALSASELVILDEQSRNIFLKPLWEYWFTSFYIFYTMFHKRSEFYPLLLSW